jgi:hypothetical protein
MNKSIQQLLMTENLTDIINFQPSITNFMKDQHYYNYFLPTLFQLIPKKLPIDFYFISLN